MYDVYFSYFDGNDHLCTNVDKIEIPTSSGIRTYSGDELHLSILGFTQRFTCIVLVQVTQFLQLG